MTTPEKPTAKDETESVTDEPVEMAGAELAAGETVGADAAVEETANAETEMGKHRKPPRQRTRGVASPRVLAYAVLPSVALLLALGGGFLKWAATTAHDMHSARTESVRAATDSAVAMLSYRADTVEKDLGAVGDRLTGHFKDSYNALTRDVVMPGAKEKRISATARVPVAASVSASGNHAVVLVFINQIVSVGTETPINTASSVRVTLDKIYGRWLISDFTPV